MWNKKYKKLKKDLREKSLSLGFPLFGISKPNPFKELKYFTSWLDNGFNAGMQYLKNRLDERTSLKKYFPEVRSIISVGMPYFNPETTPKNYSSSNPQIAHYAKGLDYHDIMKKRLNKIVNFLNQVFPCKTRICVDTSPVLDRLYAYHAGLGWFGKNTCILNQNYGSYFFLGEILTDIDFPHDSKASDHCGTCTRCLDACPTDAFPKPYVLNANKCISYWTIEYRGSLPQNQRSNIGAHLFGCDICQEVCPWNHHTKNIKVDPVYQPKWSNETILQKILETTPQNFSTIFQGMALKRAKRQGLLRNAAWVIVNLKYKKFLPSLKKIIKELPEEESDLKQEIQNAVDQLNQI